MEYSFPRYLLAKQSVDDRALNKDVLQALRSSLPPQPLRIIEVGGGIGTMIRRLVRWEVVRQCEYVLVDEQRENIEYAAAWLKAWAEETGLGVEERRPVARGEQNQIRVFDQSRDVRIRLAQADVFDFIERNDEPADLLIAHAFLDLLPMPEALIKLLRLTRELAWLTINFDGVTTFEPPVHAALDAQIEALYHETMDHRPSGGESRSGRRLFGYLRQAQAEILAAGASDWVVYASKGKYAAEEAYFLYFILHFVEEALKGKEGLNPVAFEEWLQVRRAQIERGELVYLAHQMDFLVRRSN
jgi:hypothetical protein